MDQIRVLIVDDSAFMRHALGRLLSEAPNIEVVGAASNGEEGLRLAGELRPDVITLDVEMPVLDGLGMLKRLMLETPTRVVMLSSRTTEGARTTLDALEYGAIDFVPKPSGSLSVDIGRVDDDLVAKITAAAGMSEAAFLRHRQVAAMNLTLINNRARLDAAAQSAEADAQAPGGFEASVAARHARCRRRAGSAAGRAQDRRPQAGRDRLLDGRSERPARRGQGATRRPGSGRRDRPAHAPRLHRIARRPPRVGRPAALLGGRQRRRPGGERDPRGARRFPPDLQHERPRPARQPPAGERRAPRRRRHAAGRGPDLARATDVRRPDRDGLRRPRGRARREAARWHRHLPGRRHGDDLRHACRGRGGRPVRPDPAAAQDRRQHRGLVRTRDRRPDRAVDSEHGPASEPDRPALAS